MTSRTAKIADVLRRFPNLGAYGFDTPPPAALDDFAQQVGTARTWLDLAPDRAHKVLQRFGSYRAKHIIERDMGGYVSNGAAMVAAVLAGYDLERSAHASPNARFIKS